VRENHRTLPHTPVSVSPPSSHPAADKYAMDRPDSPTRGPRAAELLAAKARANGGRGPRRPRRGKAVQDESIYRKPVLRYPLASVHSAFGTIIEL